MYIGSAYYGMGYNKGKSEGEKRGDGNGSDASPVMCVVEIVCGERESPV
jgi:hypothetical protein